MNHYEAFGLTLQSDVELPELSPVADVHSDVDVVIRRDVVEPVPPSVEQQGRLRIQTDSDSYRLSYESIGTFLVESGSTIRFDPINGDITTQKVFRRLVEKELMALLLSQRGFLVLHASAVLVDGQAVVFLGQQGTGKSTTAAAFHGRGYPVLDDDVVGICFADGTPRAVAGVPQLRLAPEAVDALDIDGTVLPENDWGPTKRYKPIDRAPNAAPVARIYVLQTGETVTRKEIPPGNKQFVLVTSTYVQGLLTESGLVAEHFHHCANIVENVPIYRLQRPKVHDALPDLVDLVVDDVRTTDRSV